jgi:photosystem II stability/assembly factor-like uncharacterized protein
MPDLATDIRNLVEGGIRPVELGEIPRSHESSGPSHARAALMSVAAAVVVLGALGIALLARTSSTGHQNRPAVGSASRAMPWKLSGDIVAPGWQVASSPASTSESLTCPSESTCYALGISEHPVPPGSATVTLPQTVVEVTHDGGARWTSSVPAPGEEIGGVLMGLTCPTTNTCMIAGAEISPAATAHLYTTTNGGRSWTASVMPKASEGGVTQLSCVTATRCVAFEIPPSWTSASTTGFDSLVTTDGGEEWTTTHLPLGFYPYALSCSVASRCVAVGKGPQANAEGSKPGPAMAIYSTNDGATWKVGHLPSDNGGFPLISALSCADATHCLAVEPLYLPNNHMSRILTTRDGGVKWTTSTYTSPKPVELVNVSCPTVADCWASGSQFQSNTEFQHVVSEGYIMTTRNGGATWSPESVPTYQGALPAFVVSQMFGAG